ncbi:hypothetical protein ACJQWK_10467 [Exserohilum turcicum]
MGMLGDTAVQTSCKTKVLEKYKDGFVLLSSNHHPITENLEAQDSLKSNLTCHTFCLKMKFFANLALAALTLFPAVRGDAVPWERIDKNNSLLLILDLQVGLYHVARDWDPSLYKQNIMAHAEIGKLFNLPVIMSTSADQGPNGPLPKEMLEMYPDAPLIRRQGEVNAWDNPEFQAAIKATGKKQIIVAGITTDVCTAFLALSLRAEGYSVFANVEGSGTYTELVRDTANSRMQQAGVQLVSLFAIVCDLMRDWRNTPGAKEVLPFLDKYLPVYGMLARHHAAAADNGTIIPGEIGLITGNNGSIVI